MSALTTRVRALEAMTDELRAAGVPAFVLPAVGCMGLECIATELENDGEIGEAAADVLRRIAGSLFARSVELEHELTEHGIAECHTCTANRDLAAVDDEPHPCIGRCGEMVTAFDSCAPGFCAQCAHDPRWVTLDVGLTAAKIARAAVPR